MRNPTNETAASGLQFSVTLQTVTWNQSRIPTGPLYMLSARAGLYSTKAARGGRINA